VRDLAHPFSAVDVACSINWVNRVVCSPRNLGVTNPSDIPKLYSKLLGVPGGKDFVSVSCGATHCEPSLSVCGVALPA
jgi:hypothetical protein